MVVQGKIFATLVVLGKIFATLEVLGKIFALAVHSLRVIFKHPFRMYFITNQKPDQDPDCI